MRIGLLTAERLIISFSFGVASSCLSDTLRSVAKFRLAEELEKSSGLNHLSSLHSIKSTSGAHFSEEFALVETVQGTGTELQT